MQDLLKEKLFDKYLSQPKSDTPTSSTEGPTAVEEPSATEEPSADKESSTNKEPSANEEPTDPKKQLIDEVLKGIFR